MPTAGPGPSPRAAVKAIDPYVPGAVPPAVDRALKLASNENPFGPSPLAVEAARLALADVNRYPEAGAPTLRAKLAAKHGVAADQILVGAGSDETLYLLANTYLELGRHAVMADPAYGIHRISARAAGATVTQVPCVDGVHDLAAMADAARAADAPGVLYVANPHNPTGTVVGADPLAQLVDGVPRDWLIVVDEAYHDFVDPGVRATALDLLGRHPGTRSPMPRSSSRSGGSGRRSTCPRRRSPRRPPRSTTRRTWPGPSARRWPRAPRSAGRST